MKKLLKGIFIIISICCIAFTAFFFTSLASGNTSILSKIEAGVSMIGHKAGMNNAGSSADSSTSTLSMLKNDFGLSTNQAAKVINVAGQLGVNTDDPAEMRSFIAKNADNASAIKEVANMYESGQISDAQAKAMLSGIVEL